jgi:hypothetical protein
MELMLQNDLDSHSDSCVSTMVLQPEIFVPLLCNRVLVKFLQIFVTFYGVVTSKSINKWSKQCSLGSILIFQHMSTIYKIEWWKLELNCNAKIWNTLVTKKSNNPHPPPPPKRKRNWASWVHIVSPRLTTQNFSLPVCVHSHFWPRWRGHELRVERERERERERESIQEWAVTILKVQQFCHDSVHRWHSLLKRHLIQLESLWATVERGAFYRIWIIGPAFDSKCWHGHRTTKDDKCCPAFGKCQCFYCFMQPNTDSPWL